LFALDDYDQPSLIILSVFSLYRETSLLSELEKEKIPMIQERLKQRLFMCNISVKANLMMPWKGGEENIETA